MLLQRKADVLPGQLAVDDLEPWLEAEPLSDSWNLRRCLTALQRHRIVVITVPILALGVAVAYLSVATPVYEARAKLLIDSQTQNVVNFKEVIEQNTTKLDYYETQLGILRSRTLARKTLNAVDGWGRPEFVRRQTGKLSGIAQRLRSFTNSIINPAWRPAVAPKDETASQSHAIDEFLTRLTISYRADNRLVDVGFRSNDPQLAADVANALVRSFIDQNLELKLRVSKEASDWLNARLAQQRKQVEDSENVLQRYREQNADVSSSQQQNVIFQKLAELSTATTRAKTERIEAEALLKQLTAIQDQPAGFDALPILLTNPKIQELEMEYEGLQRDRLRLAETLGNRHPDLVKVEAAIPQVQQRLRAEIAKVATSVHNQISTIRERERGLAAELEAQERLALAANRREIQYGALAREVASNRQIFEALLERAKQTEIASELKIANTQIVDAAEVPQVPASPQSRLVLFLALFLGLPLGVAAAVGLDYFDDRIKSPEEITANLRIKFLGFAPAVSRRTAGTSNSVIGADLPDDFGEALRIVRANVFMSAPREGTTTLLVTSTRPGEGKTMVASNLAVALAQAGRKVLLIDADMRSCQLHRIFKLPLEPGLSSILEGSLSLTEAVHPSDIPNLSVVTSGVPPHNPGDLLERIALRELLASVRDRFDWILIDSPPVMAASDAALLAQMSSAVLFVIGAQMTTYRDARAAVEQLERAHTKILGAVLNRSTGRFRSYVASQHYSAHRLST